MEEQEGLSDGQSRATWDEYRDEYWDDGLPFTHLPANGPAASHTRTLGAVELDSTLQVCEAGTLLECFAPTRPVAMQVSTHSVATVDERGDVLGVVQGPHGDQRIVGPRRVVVTVAVSNVTIKTRSIDVMGNQSGCRCRCRCRYGQVEMNGLL